MPRDTRNRLHIYLRKVWRNIMIGRVVEKTWKHKLLERIAKRLNINIEFLTEDTIKERLQVISKELEDREDWLKRNRDIDSNLTYFKALANRDDCLHKKYQLQTALGGLE